LQEIGVTNSKGTGRILLQHSVGTDRGAVRNLDKRRARPR